MKILAVLLLLVYIPSLALAEESLSDIDCNTQKFLVDIAVHNMSNASWKYRVLTLLDRGEIEEAKQTLVDVQTSDIFILEQLEKENKLSSTSKRSLHVIKKYNETRKKQ